MTASEQIAWLKNHKLYQLYFFRDAIDRKLKEISTQHELEKYMQFIAKIYIENYDDLEMYERLFPTPL